MYIECITYWFSIIIRSHLCDSKQNYQIFLLEKIMQCLFILKILFEIVVVFLKKILLYIYC
jgi:hypothetical protein